MCCINEYVDNTYVVGRLLQQKTPCCSMQPREALLLQHLTSSSERTVVFNKLHVVVCARDHVPFSGVVSNFHMMVWRHVFFIFVVCCVAGTLISFQAH